MARLEFQTFIGSAVTAFINHIFNAKRWSLTGHWLFLGENVCSYLHKTWQWPMQTMHPPKP